MSRLANRNDQNTDVGSRTDSRNERKDTGSRMSRKDRYKDSKTDDPDEERRSDTSSRQSKAKAKSPTLQRESPGPSSNNEKAKEGSNDRNKGRDRSNDSRVSKYKDENDDGKKSRNSRAEKDGKVSRNGTDSRAGTAEKSSRNGNKSGEEDNEKRSQSRNKSRSDDNRAKSRHGRLSREDEENDVRLVKLADNAERYDYMSEFMMEFAKNKKYLDKGERDLLWISFRKRVKTYRKSWRVVSLSEENDREKDQKHFLESKEDFKKNIEKELVQFCESFLKLLDDTLLPSVEKNHSSKDERKEAEIFYEKLRGDTYRYLWELVLDNKEKRDMRKNYGEKAKDAYINAWRDAEKCLGPADSLRLGLALNYSVLIYEVMGDHKLAIDTAKSAMDKADKDIDHLKGEEKKDAEYIIDMLEENLKLWNKD